MIKVPDRGPFAFPHPWNTHACRVTNADDGIVRPVGYTYWPQMNNSAGRSWAWIFLSLNDRYTLFRLDKATLRVERVKDLPFEGWGEGSYFSFSKPDRLYVPRGSQLLAHDVESGVTQVVVDAPGPIRQCHSSANGHAHSMTLDGMPAVYRRGEFVVFQPRDTYDECQIDKSGRWLLIKEGNYNRVIDLDSGDESTISDAEGAVGHSDMGFGYVVGEEDQSNPGGVFKVWKLPRHDHGRVYTTGSWERATRYVSHCNAQPGDPATQRAVFSSIQDDIVLAQLDGLMQRTPIAPSLCVPSDEYWQQPRATFDPTGEFAIWTANLGTDRLDAFVVRIPVERAPHSNEGDDMAKKHPTDPDNLPDFRSLVQAVYARGGFDLTTLEGDGVFTRAVAPEIHEADPRFVMLKKSAGRTHVIDAKGRRHAGDALLFLLTPTQGVAIDIIGSSASADAEPAWTWDRYKEGPEKGKLAYRYTSADGFAPDYDTAGPEIPPAPPKPEPPAPPAPRPKVTYDQFINGPNAYAKQIDAAYRERHGHPPATTDQFHNAWRILVEGWTIENVIKDIRK